MKTFRHFLLIYKTHSLKTTIKWVTPYSEGMFTTATVTNEERLLKIRFVLKRILILAKECCQRLSFKFWKKNVDLASIQNSVNETELRKYFEDLSRRMRIIWDFSDQSSNDFSDKPAFYPKSDWKPPSGHPVLERFLSQLEKKTFIVFLNDSLFVSSNKSKEDWEALRGLADERDIVIKQAVKGLCGLVLCRDDYIKEDDKNLEEKVIYKDIKQFFRTW